MTDMTNVLEYLRKKSIVYSTGSFITASDGNGSSIANFTATTSSIYTVLSPITTSINDFIFFNNGLFLNYDALSVEQSGSIFILTINTGSLGYALDIDDEVIGWGKFE